MLTVIEILVDFSSSMSGKLVKTKGILLNQVIPSLDFSSRIGVKTFTAEGNKRNLKIEEKLPLSIINKEQLEGTITGLNSPNGNTPIAAAIVASVQSLKEYMAFNKKIILITDGEENCGGDYEQEAKNARRDGIECEIHTIGLDLKPEAQLKVERIAKLTGGTFINIALNTIVGDNYSPIANQIKDLATALKGKPLTTSTSGNGAINREPPPSTTNGIGKPNDSASGPSEEPTAKSESDSQNGIPTIKTEDDEILVPKEQPDQHPTNETLSSPPEDEQNEGLPQSEEFKTESQFDDPEFQEENKRAEGNIENTEGVELKSSDLPPNNLENQPLELEIKSVKSTLDLVVKELQSIKNDLIDLKKKSEPGEQEYIEIKEDPVLNESIRQASEKYVFDLLNKKYPDRVKWLNENGESGEDHDFEILESEEKIEYYIECKGTSTGKNTFLLTKNEWRLFLNNTRNYQVYFVKNALSGNPDYVFINNLLDWILKGKIVPYFNENSKLKGERIPLTLLD